MYGASVKFVKLTHIQRGHMKFGLRLDISLARRPKYYSNLFFQTRCMRQEYGGKSKLTTNSRSTVKQKCTHSKVWTSAVALAGEAETGAIYAIGTKRFTVKLPSGKRIAILFEVIF